MAVSEEDVVLLCVKAVIERMPRGKGDGQGVVVCNVELIVSNFCCKVTREVSLFIDKCTITGFVSTLYIVHVLHCLLLFVNPTIPTLMIKKTNDERPTQTTP